MNKTAPTAIPAMSPLLTVCCGVGFCCMAGGSEIVLADAGLLERVGVAVMGSEVELGPIVEKVTLVVEVVLEEGLDALLSCLL